MISLTIFEIGSLICGVAPSSVAFIIGRAIAGIGSAGLFSGSFILIAYLVPLEKRPMYTGLIGGIYGVASVIGPLVSVFSRFVVRTILITEQLRWGELSPINFHGGGVSISIFHLGIIQIPFCFCFAYILNPNQGAYCHFNPDFLPPSPKRETYAKLAIYHRPIRSSRNFRLHTRRNMSITSSPVRRD